jgi:hypothetical protein
MTLVSYSYATTNVHQIPYIFSPLFYVFNSISQAHSPCVLTTDASGNLLEMLGCESAARPALRVLSMKNYDPDWMAQAGGLTLPTRASASTTATATAVDDGGGVGSQSLARTVALERGRVLGNEWLVGHPTCLHFCTYTQQVVVGFSGGGVAAWRAGTGPGAASSALLPLHTRTVHGAAVTALNTALLPPSLQGLQGGNFSSSFSSSFFSFFFYVQLPVGLPVSLVCLTITWLPVFFSLTC